MITREESVKAYEDLIQLRRSEVLEKDKAKLGQIEIHHIFPTSCGGEDVEDNKIALYAKEHFMAHVYLWVIHHDDEFHYQTMCALTNMIKGTVSGDRTELRDFILASEEYQKAREEFSKYTSETISLKISGEKNGAYGKHWYYNPLTLETKMYYDDNIPHGWKLGRIVNERDRTITTQILMNKANNVELQKRINACRVVFFTMYYQYYLKYGFEKTVETYNLNIERTALLHLFKKYVSDYKRYNRWKFK